MSSFSSLILTLVYLFCGLAHATIYVQYNTSFPDNITASCSSALMSDIPSCSSSITLLRPSLYYPNTTLESLCTAACNSALNSYESQVDAACQGQTFESGQSGYVPLSTVPGLLRYLFNYTCLTDSTSGQYCNVIAAETIGILADQSNLNSENITGGGNLTCSDCDLKSLQFLAGAAYYHDNNAVSMYSSLTSSCHATGYPLTTSTLGFTASPTTTTATITPTCTGSTYTIKAGDTCQSISKSQSIGTNWLITDNDLTAYCSNFPTNGTLCIGHPCTTYTVQANDTCNSIVKSQNITYAQILAWNPVFDLTCSNLNSSLGLEICVSSPGTAYTAPSATLATLTTATVPTTVPTNAANGTTTDCGAWYEAESGDYCNLLVLRFGISLDDFLVLNPEVNANCTNLYAEESYCILPVGDISNYPGAFGYVPPVPSYTTIPFSSLPTATYIPSLYVPPDANLTIANGTRTDCGSYIDGSDYQTDVTNTTFANTCELAAAVYGATMDELVLWNPSLGNASDTNCSFLLNTKYCVAWSALSATATALPAIPTATGIISGCTQYTYADVGVACSDILNLWNITLAYFYALNPSVGSDCSGFEIDTYYCALTNSTVSLPTSTASVSKTSIVTPPGPTQTGIISTCNAYYVTPATGASCTAIESLYDISFAEFYAWNPAVGSNCQNLWASEAYCVGVSGGSASTTTTSKTTSSSTQTSVTPPGPTQSGIISTCNEYYVTPATGASCTAIESLYSITFATFYAWNPAVGSNCENLWASEAYCVGVSSSPTSTTKTTTSSTSTKVTPPAATQSGIISTCDAYYVTPATGASCAAIESLYGITFATFYAWNPAVGSNCQNLWAEEAYCVGVSS